MEKKVAKKGETGKGGGRARLDVDMNEVQKYAMMGAKLTEIASIMHVSIDTLLKRIKELTPYPNYAEFKRNAQEGGKALIRSFAFNHAKKNQEMCKFMLINLIPDEFQLKPIPKEGEIPRIQLIDSVEDTNYELTMRAHLKNLGDDENTRLLLLDLATLLPHQRKFVLSNAEITGMIAGFGAGKTFAFIRKALFNAFTELSTKRKRRYSRGLIVYPSLPLAEELFVEPMRELLDDLQIPYRYRANTYMFKIAGFATIKIYTLDRPEKIVGSEYTYAMIDEFDTVPHEKAKHAFEKITGRLRGKENARLDIVTTPEGFKFTYNLFVRQVQNNPELESSRELIHAKSTDNKYLPASYIQKLRRNYDPVMLQQYLDGQFVNINGAQAYYSYNQNAHVKKYKKDTPRDLYIGIDFNVDPMTCTIWDIDFEYTEEETRIGFAHCISDVKLRNSNTRSMADYLRELYPDNNFNFYPDPAGRQRKSSADIGVTDITILEEYGNVFYIKKSVPVKDKLNVTNSLFARNKIAIDPSCRELILDYEQVITDDKGQIMKNDKDRTHTSDGAGYMFYMLDFIDLRGGWGAK